MPLTAEKIWRVLCAHPRQRRFRHRRQRRLQHSHAEAVGYALELVERRARDRDPVAILSLERSIAPLAWHGDLRAAGLSRQRLHRGDQPLELGAKHGRVGEPAMSIASTRPFCLRRSLVGYGDRLRN